MNYLTDMRSMELAAIYTAIAFGLATLSIGISYMVRTFSTVKTRRDDWFERTMDALDQDRRD